MQSHPSWVGVVTAGVLGSFIACTSIIGDGYVIEDEDEDDDGNNSDGNNSDGNNSDGNNSDGSDPCAASCDACGNCYCSVELANCYGSFACSDCLADPTFCDIFDPATEALFNCVQAYCAGMCEQA